MKKYFFVSFYQPFETFQIIFKQKRKLGYASLALLTLGMLYTFTLIVGYQNGFGAVVKPFLCIDPEKYYFYETFFGIPVFFTIAIVFAGLSRLLASAMGGKGSFENNFVIYCTASVIPTLLTMWIPETMLMVFFPDARAMPLGGFKNLPLWLDVLRQVIGIVWPLIISVIGLQVSEKLNVFKSTLIAFHAFVVSAAIMLIFIR